MLYDPLNGKEPSVNQQLEIKEENDDCSGCLGCSLEALAIFSGVIMFWLYLVS